MSNPQPLKTFQSRVADTSAADAAETVEEKVVALTNTLSNMHWGHNEARRLIPLILEGLVEIVTGIRAREDSVKTVVKEASAKKAPAKKAPAKKAAPAKTEVE